MRNSIYRITLDMHDVASQVQITAKQHDTARKLHITLSENGSPYTIEEGCRAVLTINRSGSTVIIDDCEIKLNGSVIMYDFNSQTTEVLGINECEVKLYGPDGDIITSPRFTLLVDENVYNDGEDHGIDHRNVLNRDKEDQHPIKAITGLEKELESKANAEKIYAEIALDRSRIDNIAALGQNSVIEVQKKYNTTGDTTPLTFTLGNDGKCVVIIYYYKSAPNTETYSSSVLVNSQSIFTKTLDGAAGTYLEEVEFDGHSGDIVTITRDNVNVSINSVLYLTKNTTDNELADIRLGADGTIYPCAGDAVRGQVSALKDDVDTQVGALKSDLENENDVTGELIHGTAIDARNGNTRTDLNEHCVATDFITISHELEYYYSGTTYNFVGVAGYDKNNNYVCSILSGTTTTKVHYQEHKLEIPQNVYKIRASQYRDLADELTLSVIEKTIFGKNALHKVNKLTDQVSNSHKINYVYVDTNGSDITGDGSQNNPFATVYKANESIIDASLTNQYVIKVADGVYTDLQERYSGVAGNGYSGVICKDYVYYEGNIINPEKVIVKWNGATGFDESIVTLSDVIKKAPFHIIGNINGLHTGINGFSFDCENLRYCIHTEMESRGFDNHWYIRNCDFTGWKGRPTLIENGNNGTQSMPSIGMGSNCGEIGIIEYCKFPQAPTEDDVCKNFDFGIVNHDNKPNAKYGTSRLFCGSNYKIENCFFNGNSIRLRSMYDIPYDTKNLAEVKNCRGIKKIIHTPSSGIPRNWNIIATACDNVEIEYQ